MQHHSKSLWWPHTRNQLRSYQRIRGSTFYLLEPFFYIFVCLNDGLDVLLRTLGATGQSHFAIVDSGKKLSWAVVTLAVIIVSVLFPVNGNKFIPHYFYRNRIIRAYLGASRTQTSRQPDPFTGLDDDDNLQMSELRGQRPRLIVNMALNLTGSDRMASQERKAEIFTADPARCGSPWLGYRDSRVYGRGFSSAKSGISLGTALAISGAAVSPNRGYMLTSAAARFLMAMFAVRLGCWLGNPGIRGNRTASLPAPRFSLTPIINEAFGHANENSSFVYLSDGGHFENLGLYEMVRRGCSHIVVSDASTDDNFEFESLAVCIRKIRIDFGIPIEFHNFGDIGRFDDDTGRCCAIGKIRYSALEPQLADGTLLYIKASMHGTEPKDVMQYSKSTGSFPQQSIADQFFSESQFESYRALGSHIVTEMLTPHANLPLPVMMANLEKQLSANGNEDRRNLINSALKRAAHG